MAKRSNWHWNASRRAASAIDQAGHVFPCCQLQVGAATPTRRAPSMSVHDRQFYARAQAELIADAYRDLFGPIGEPLRAYWDLDRQRDWGCLTSDFGVAVYEQYEEASRRALEVERTVAEPIARGVALRDVTRKTGVGLSLGICPWTDHGLFQTYARNRQSRQLTIILGHDWYPIVPQRSTRPHPVDVPLWRNDGLHDCSRYLAAGAVPPVVARRDELLLFLNLKPDYRPPNSRSTGKFEPYDRCVEGFSALLEGLATRYRVKVVSWGGPVWHLLATQMLGMRRPPGVCVRSRDSAAHGQLLELHCGQTSIPYLPLAHPCDTRNFNAQHAVYARTGFAKMGLN